MRTSHRGTDRFAPGDLVVVARGAITDMKGMVMGRRARDGAAPDPSAVRVVWANGNATWENPGSLAAIILGPADGGAR